MSVSATLQELAAQVRRDTLQILDVTQPTWLTYAPPGTSNHILWHAGHALWLQNVLTLISVPFPPEKFYSSEVKLVSVMEILRNQLYAAMLPVHR